jgi:hypothetical protein
MSTSHAHHEPLGDYYPRSIKPEFETIPGDQGDSDPAEEVSPIESDIVKFEFPNGIILGIHTAIEPRRIMERRQPEL